MNDKSKCFKQQKWLHFCLMAVFAVVLVGFTVGIRVAAGSKLTITEINYENSTITFQSTAGDSKLYLSDSKKKVWEEFQFPTGSNQLTIDISWVSVSKNYVLNFKGDKSTEVNSVTLPKQVTNFKVTYRANSENPFSFLNDGDRTIQWRKNNTTTWMSWKDENVNETLSYLFVNGATLYFRLAPKNGKENDPGLRPSKEVTVKVKAKSAAPKITLNASNFTISLKNGMSYRVVNSNETVADTKENWVKVTSTRAYSLSELAPAVLYSGTDLKASGKETVPVSIQFKTAATEKAQESKITTISIPAQEAAPSDEGIEIAYTSSSSLKLTVSAASSRDPFEYSIVKKDEELDYSSMTWSNITTGSGILISETKAPEGSSIYIRRKANSSLGKDDFKMASDALKVADNITYPTAPEFQQVTNITASAGTIHKDGYQPQFTLNSYTETKVSSITFLTKDGINMGKAECSSEVATNTNSKGEEDKFIITTTITSVAGVESSSSAIGQTLYAEITLENGDKIVSEDNKGVTLKLYPASKVVDKPEFKRIYQSNDDQKYFDFDLDFGTDKVNGTEAGAATELTKITYDNTTLTLGTCSTEEEAVSNTQYNAMVWYDSHTDSNNKNIRRANVIIHADTFEETIKTTNSKIPFVITLNNNEVLTDQVSMTLVETATLNEAPIAWTITERSLATEAPHNKVDENNNVTSSTVPVNDYTLTLTKADPSYDVSVSDVTWGGQSILYSASVSGGTITITLSNAKINLLSATANGVGPSTNNIVIKLSNGFTISKGCKLTILQAVETNTTN